MPEVIGIRFKPCGKIYEFDINGINANPGVWVVVESEMGLSLGLVVKGRYLLDQPQQQLKKIIRIATVEDIEADRGNRSFEDEARSFCMEKIKKRILPMKVVGVEATLDRKRLIFYFTAEGRIDFRELVRDLASKFKTRIEMRQIGVRDEIKFIGGIGVCGREVCCKVFLSSFAPVSIRMAKKQELVLNPGKLSGICGRLMCCLGYEIGGPEEEKKVPGRSAGEKDAQFPELEIEETVVAVSEPACPAGRPAQPDEHLPTRQVNQGGPVAAPEAARARQDAQRPQADLPTGQAGVHRQVHDKTHIHKNHVTDKGKPFSRRKKFWGKKKKH